MAWAFRPLPDGYLDREVLRGETPPRQRAGRPHHIRREEKVPTDKPCPDSDSAGLCARCKHVALSGLIQDHLSIFAAGAPWDPAYPQYPRLPVLACRGHEGKSKRGGQGW